MQAGDEGYSAPIGATDEEEEEHRTERAVGSSSISGRLRLPGGVTSVLMPGVRNKRCRPA